MGLITVKKAYKRFYILNLMGRQLSVCYSILPTCVGEHFFLILTYGSHVTLGIIYVRCVLWVLLACSLRSLELFVGFFLTRRKTTRNYGSDSNKMSRCPFDHLFHLHAVDIVKKKNLPRALQRSRTRHSRGGEAGPGPGQVECCESQVEQLTAPRR